MARNKVALTSGRVFSLVLVIFVIAILYLAKELLIPFALAILLTFILTPLCQRLERLGLGRISAVSTVVILALLISAAMGYIVAGQVLSLAENIGSYEEKIKNKVEYVTESISPGEGSTFSRIQEIIDDVTEAAQPDKVPQMKSKEAGATGEEEPVPVAVVAQPASQVGSYVTMILTPIASVLATTGVVLLFTFFMLLEREDMRNRLVRLVGLGQLSVTTQALDEAADRVSRYLLMQLLVNATYGLVTGICLYFIGVPNAILWGVLAAMLRYVPYIGPWIAAAIPILLSIIAYDNWTPALLTCGMFVVLELVSNNVMEPLLYRSSTGVSTIGIIVSAVFWTWLWGPIGLVLATPMTVCIAVIGRYVPQMWFLNVLLTDEAPLDPGTRYYQRLLADDSEEANEVLEEFSQEHSHQEIFDTILLPALEWIEKDGHHGALEEGRQAYLREYIQEAVVELADRQLPAAPAGASGKPTDGEILSGDTVTIAPASTRHCIACLPARDEADEIAAKMLAQVLEAHGHCAKAFSIKSLAGEMLDEIEQQKFDFVFVSAVPPFGGSHTRYLCKRLHSRFPDLKLHVALWQTTPVSAKTAERLKSGCATKVVTTLAEAAAVVM